MQIQASGSCQHAVMCCKSQSFPLMLDCRHPWRHSCDCIYIKGRNFDGYEKGSVVRLSIGLRTLVILEATLKVVLTVDPVNPALGEYCSSPQILKVYAYRTSEEICDRGREENPGRVFRTTAHPTPVGMTKRAT
ncbi:hypothetical protein ScPMuIL_001812 [Solemya velum]